MLPISSTYKLVHQNFPRLSVFPDGYPMRTMRIVVCSCGWRWTVMLCHTAWVTDFHVIKVCFQLDRYACAKRRAPATLPLLRSPEHQARPWRLYVTSSTSNSSLLPTRSLYVSLLRPRIAVVAVLTDVAPTSGRGVVEHVRHGPHNHVVHSLRRQSAAWHVAILIQYSF